MRSSKPFPACQNSPATVGVAALSLSNIRRDAQGRWWNGGEAIAHPLLTRAFDAWIERADDGPFRHVHAPRLHGL